MSRGVARISWATGALLVGSSVASSAYIQHSPKLWEADRNALKNAQQIQMLNGLGLCLLGTRKSAFTFLPVTFLLSGSVLFPGIIFYSRIYKDTRFNWLIPYGGGASILGWLFMVAC